MTMDHHPIEDGKPLAGEELAANGRVALLILGAHRSGTSAITRVLSLLGCRLPNTLLESNGANPAGYWESDAICAFNGDLLEAAGSSWNDWQALNPGWAQSPIRADFMRRAAQVLRSEFEDGSLIVLKDPRICRFAPFWLDVLSQEGFDPRIVIPVRNPFEVASSLEHRDGIDPSLGQLIWLRHILDAERGTRGARRVFTTYNGLIEDWSSVTARVADGLGLSWPRYSVQVSDEIEAFLDRGLRHHQHVDPEALTGPRTPIWVRQAYEIFLRWAQTSESPGDFEVLAGIEQRLSEAGTVFGKPMVLLQSTHARLKTAQDELDRLPDMEARLRETQHHVEALSAELQAAHDKAAASEALRQERDAAVSRTAEIESALLQRREELRQVWADLEAERGRSGTLDATLSEQSAALDKAHGKLAAADAWVLGLTAERRQNELELARRQRLLEKAQERSKRLDFVERELTDMRRYLSTANKSLETLRKLQSESEEEASATKSQLELATSELEKVQKLAKTAVSQRSQTSHEIATVTQLLRESEEEAQRSAEDIQWSRKIYALLLKRPWWWSFLPRKMQLRKIRERVERKGLFDAEAYLARYPDVAASGTDPLRHYIMYGMGESRTR